MFIDKVTSETESADRLEGDEGEIHESWWQTKKKDFDRYLLYQNLKKLMIYYKILAFVSES